MATIISANVKNSNSINIINFVLQNVNKIHFMHFVCISYAHFHWNILSYNNDIIIIISHRTPDPSQNTKMCIL